ncbi:MAG: YggS family pyridoxal phosphate-dependent enzyme [Sporomusaceae bacterium]|nr:YggS family pyridoxal phosphate-dependent enzyme [Sporomusaceae bacterium]
MSIDQAISHLLEHVHSLAAARRDAFPELPAVRIAAVTKNQSAQTVKAALAAGLRIAAENRVQEALQKHAVIGEAAEWHFIGHLQTNKVKQVVPFCQLIHSLDRQELAVAIDQAAAKLNKRQDVLLQVNVSGEATKFGVRPGQAVELAKFAASLPNIRLCGCMTIAPLYENMEETRPVFRELAYLFQEIKTLNLPNSRLEWLSMGMTHDYPVAIEEGANIIRIGTGIFGKRG